MSDTSADSFVPLTTRASSRRPATGRLTTTATSVAGQDIICAVSESRGLSTTVGLAFVNLVTGEVVLCQICDSMTYVRTITKIAVFEPSEILLMDTAEESQLRYTIQKNLPGPILTFLNRRSWSDKAGLEYLDRLAFPDELEYLKLCLGVNYFAACSFGAVCFTLCQGTARYFLTKPRPSNTWSWSLSAFLLSTPCESVMSHLKVP